MVKGSDLARTLGESVADSVKIKLRTELLSLHPDLIFPDPDQPRQEFDADGLARLAASLQKHGQLQPVLIRKDERNRYVLVAGERRWRAAKLAGMRTIQALYCKSGDIRSVQLVENLLREDLKPIEQAKAYQAIMAMEKWSARELARQLNVEHTGIAKALRLLKLDPEIQEAVDEGKLPHTTAYEISKQPGETQVPLARAAVAGTLKGDDLRRQAPDRKATTPAPQTLPLPLPKLTLGGIVVDDAVWTYSLGKVRLEVTGHRDAQSLIQVLEKALDDVLDGKAPLAGGVGRVKK